MILGEKKGVLFSGFVQLMFASIDDDVVVSWVSDEDDYEELEIEIEGRR